MECERTPAVERGDVPVLDDVLAEITAVQGRIERHLADGDTPLPSEPDLDTVTAWAVDAHRRHWGW